MNDNDIKKLTTSLIESMKEVFPTAEQINKSFQNAKEHTDEQFAKMDARFDHIEKILLAKQEKRIEKLEAKVKRIEEMLPA